MMCENMVTTVVLRLGLFALLIVSCGGDSNPLACDDGKCTDPERPFCDVSGIYPASAGEANTCIPEPEQRICEATGQFCENDTFYNCLEGEFAEERACARGCNAAEDGCAFVTPSNGLRPYMEMTFTAPDVNVSQPTVIDTDAGTVTENGNPINIPSFLVPGAQNGGVDMQVFVVASWSSGEVTVVGRPALAIVSRGLLTLRAEFRIGNSGYFAGDQTFQCAPDWAPTDCLPAYDGVAGAGQSNDGKGGAGGAGQGVTEDFASATLEPLRGGCGVQSGGAIQLVSNEKIEIANKIVAVGGAGKASTCGNNVTFATGGGAGGTVLLEAPSVEITAGGIFATGGSGACFGSDGNAGLEQDNNASPAQCGVNGGNSGAGSASGNGGDGSTSGGGAQKGAGGGGVGRIRVNTFVNGFDRNGISVVPAASEGTLVAE